MRYKNIRDLKVGDWIISGNKEDKLKGKFQIGRVQEVKVTLENYEELNIEKGKIKIYEGGEFYGIDGVTQILNEKEVKALQILRIKLKVLNNLEDNPIKKKY